MNRSTLSLAAVAAALAVITGVSAAFTPSSETGSPPRASALRKPIERSTVVCPAPAGSDYATTGYAAFTPAGTGQGATGGTATLVPGQTRDVAGQISGSHTASDHPLATLAAPGKPVTASAGRTTAPLVATAVGRFAPGWSVTETTTIDAGAGRGLLGLSCPVPGADFWFPGVSTARSRQDYVHLINPDETAAVADIELYDKNGPVKTLGGEITVAGGASVPVLISTLTATRSSDLTVHVAVRSGRLGAAVQVMDDTAGSDWLSATAAPADSAVLPGIPADATAVHLVAHATGDGDADLKVRLLTPTGPITPAGHETLHVKSGMTTAINLSSLTQGQPGSLRLTPTDPKNAAPFVVALWITRGKAPSQEIGFLPATGPVDRRATVGDNSTKGATVSLTAPDGDATVKITSSQPSGGGSPASKTVQVKAGTTVAMSPPRPSGSGTYAITVETVSGGPVYASRMLAQSQHGIPAFTLQGMSDDGSTVVVPEAGADLSVLQR